MTWLGTPFLFFSRCCTFYRTIFLNWSQNLYENVLWCPLIFLYWRAHRQSTKRHQTLWRLRQSLYVCSPSEFHVLTVTGQKLRRNLFETPFAHALLAFSGPPESIPSGEAIGLALYFFNYSTWTGRPGLYVSYLPPKFRNWGDPSILSQQLEDLYVKAEYRKSGIGKAFFGQLGQIAQEKVCWLPCMIPIREKSAYLLSGVNQRIALASTGRCSR